MRPTTRARLLLALFSPLALAAVASGCAEGRQRSGGTNECGDGVRGEGEECDDGDDNGDRPDQCRADCTTPRCGDGVVDSGEDCDDGDTKGGDGCDPSCQDSYVCGDATCDEAKGESCSTCVEDCCPCGDGTCSVGEVCTACPQDCCVDCGNGELDPGEQCDDGNQTPEDGCGRGCVDEVPGPQCGNDFLEAGEECEDGNTEPGDGCSASCVFEYVCGDGVCEGGVGEDCVTCREDCCPNCGDGLVNDHEECDGGFPPGTPSCQDLCYPGGNLSCLDCLIDTSTCVGDLPECGNGVLECGEQCDGGDVGTASCDELGFDGGEVDCKDDCTVDTGGCGAFLHYFATDFDDGCPDGWSLVYPWFCGTPSVGPGAAHSGANVLASNLSGTYPPNVSFFSGVATSPAFNLTTASNPRVSFWVWHDLESGYDRFRIEASVDGIVYTPLIGTAPAYEEGVGWSGASNGWVVYSAGLGDYVGQGAVSLRFSFESDDLFEEVGVFIDDLIVEESCGNGILDDGEVCDGDVFGPDATCPDEACGLPTCAADCQAFDDASCVFPECGDGTRECDEECDEDDFDGATCSALGFDGGDLSCDSQCRVEFDGCGEAVLLVPLQGFEQCPPAGWTLEGEFECGEPTSGPNAALSGNHVAATVLDGEYPTGMAYDENYIETPEFDVVGPSPTMQWFMWLQSEATYDGLHVEVSVDGGAFELVETGLTPAYTDDAVGGTPAYDGDRTPWTAYRLDLSPWQGQPIRVRLAFYSDGLYNAPGAYIDDVAISPDASVLPFKIANSLPRRVFTVGGLSRDLEITSDIDVIWTITEQTNAAWVTIDPDTGLVEGDPAPSDAGSASITVRAAATANPGSYSEITYDFDVIDGAWGEDFEDCDGAELALTGGWLCGEPPVGPSSAHGGRQCLGMDGYEDDIDWGDRTATTPRISLVGAVNPRVTFWLWQAIEDGYDGSHLEVSTDGVTWEIVENPSPDYTETYEGQDAWEDFSSWTQVTASLADHAGEVIQLRWSFFSDTSNTDDGAFVDDVQIVVD